MSNFVMVDGHPVSKERAAVLAKQGNASAKAALAGKAVITPAVAEAAQLADQRRAAVAAGDSKRKQAATSRASAILKPKGLDAQAAKDVALDEKNTPPAVSTVTPEQLAEAEAVVEEGGLSAQVEAKLVMNGEAGAAAVVAAEKTDEERFADVDAFRAELDATEAAAAVPA